MGLKAHLGASNPEALMTSLVALFSRVCPIAPNSRFRLLSAVRFLVPVVIASLVLAEVLIRAFPLVPFYNEVQVIPDMTDSLPDDDSIRIYCLVVRDLYDRDSFTRGRAVVVFVDPLAKKPVSSGVLFPVLQPSDGVSLPVGLVKALGMVMPARNVSFAYAWDVIEPIWRRTGGRVRGGGAFITLSPIEFKAGGDEAEVTTSLYYGSLGASSLQYTLAKIDGEWRITALGPGAIA